MPRVNSTDTLGFGAQFATTDLKSDHDDLDSECLWEIYAAYSNELARNSDRKAWLGNGGRAQPWHNIAKGSVSTQSRPRVASSTASTAGATCGSRK